MDRLDGDEEGTLERGAQPPITPAPMANHLCAICIHNHMPTTIAVTLINGTAVCEDHARVAPRASLPLAT